MENWQIRAEYEYIKTNAHVFREVLSTFADLAQGYTGELRVRQTSDVQFGVLAELAGYTDAARDYVRQYAFEAAQTLTAIGERLDEIVAWYEDASRAHAAALRLTP